VDRFDIDGNKTLERMELAALVTGIGGQCTDDEIDQIFDLADQNSDRHITFDELYAIVTKDNKPALVKKFFLKMKILSFMLQLI